MSLETLKKRLSLGTVGPADHSFVTLTLEHKEIMMPSRHLTACMLAGVLAASCLRAAAAEAPVVASVDLHQVAAKTALGDLSGFRAIAVDTQRIVQTGDFGAAKKRIKDLELSWDEAEPNIKSRAPKAWETVDIAIDQALKEVRAWRATKESSSQALRALIAAIDAVK